MPEPESENKKNPTTVEPIEGVIEQMLASLKEKKECVDELCDRVAEKLKNRLVLDEFKQWLGKDSIRPSSDLPWIELLRPEAVKDAAFGGAAWDCLQVVVLAYLPGPRYFQGIYIYSNLHDHTSLKRMKESFQVPHLSGALGWMSACSLNPNNKEHDSYVTIYDAQLDLRGRSAVPDLWLGDRSVLGFPVSIKIGNRELASISGFVFFSHPVPGVFPEPSDEKRGLSKAFTDVRKMYESALASTIESHIFRDYSKFILTSREKPKESERIPLLRLSDDDPTGFLVSILFESGPTGALSVECEINEDVFLETMSWYLRVASMYPEKWEPKFVRHLRRLGDLIEGANVHHLVPIVWYSPGEKQAVQNLYPAGIPKEDREHLAALLNQTTHEPDMPQLKQRPGGVRGGLADISNLYRVASVHSRHFDLVVPIYCERESSTISLGFFRFNCDASDIRDAGKVESAFQNLWRALKETHDEINADIARLIFALEEGRYNSGTSHSRQPKGKKRSTEVQHIRLWMDASHLISEWLAWQMQRLVLHLTTSEPTPEQPPGPDEELISFALKAFPSPHNEKLEREFNSCSSKWGELLNRPMDPFVNPFPEITFITFWPRLKLPVLNDIAQIVRRKGPSAEEKFSGLLLEDPGLLRMLTILAPMLDPGEEVIWQSGGPRSNENWENLDFGVPTSGDITSLKVKGLSNVKSPALDITWEQTEEHHLRLRWDCEDGDAQRRYLGRAISVAPGTVARRLGKYILAGLEVKLQPNGLDELNDREFDRSRYYDILKFVDSPEREELKERIGWLERLMLYEARDAAGWRILRVKEHPPAFLAVLCDQRVNRSAVLAFRDFALANARAFYVARENEAQREAAEDYNRSLYAVAHGYKAPIGQLVLAVSQAKAFISNNLDKQLVQTEMKKLEDMITSAETLAEDAMFYAWRKTESTLKPQTWRDMRKQIELVIQAIDLPRSPRVQFDHGNLDEDAKVDISPYLWRHLLSKLIYNGLEHGIEDPKESTSFEVFLRPEIIEQRLVLSISNFVSAEKQEEAVTRVRTGLKDGQLELKKGEPSAPRKKHGYGLIEAYTCCRLLRIEAKVEANKKASQLVISLWMALTG